MTGRRDLRLCAVRRLQTLLGESLQVVETHTAERRVEISPDDPRGHAAVHDVRRRPHLGGHPATTLSLGARRQLAKTRARFPAVSGGERLTLVVPEFTPHFALPAEP
jgi:hypothetical protein